MQKNVSPSGYLPSFQHFATQAIHVGQEPEQWNSRALVIPISLATTFKQDTPGQSSVSRRAGRASREARRTAGALRTRGWSRRFSVKNQSCNLVNSVATKPVPL